MQRVSEQSLVLSSARRWARPWPQRAPLAAFYIPNLALATSGHNVVGKTIDETFVVVHAPLLSGYAAHAAQARVCCCTLLTRVIRWVCCRLEPWPGDRKAKLSPVRPVALCVLGGVVQCSERGLFGDEDNSILYETYAVVIAFFNCKRSHRVSFRRVDVRVGAGGA